MRVLVAGKGGREHALVSKLSIDGGVEAIFCCPGNPGMAKLATCLPVAANDAEGLLAASREHSIDLVVFGPEEPLIDGAGDLLRREGLTVFGPSARAAQLEGSKVFAKLFMRHHGIPTAGFEVYDSFSEASKYVSGLGGPVVVKADGLAKGKGVIVCDGPEEAVVALKQIMVERIFGAAGERILVEERLYGEEISVMAICDGKEYVLLPCSQDHKRVFDGDTGPNTGGMGAYCPVRWAGKDVMRVVESQVIRPVLSGMAEMEEPFTGVLYAGLMLTSDGPRVLEFNCRFGDPEAQAVLSSCRFDLGELLFGAARGRIDMTRRLEADSSSVCVVLCSRGYPGPYEDGKSILGLERLKNMEGVSVFHAGTTVEQGSLRTAGGRVLDVVAVKPTMEQAIATAYEAAGMVSFDGIHYRRDIGKKAWAR